MHVAHRDPKYNHAHFFWKQLAPCSSENKPREQLEQSTPAMTDLSDSDHFFAPGSTYPPQRQLAHGERAGSTEKGK
jgi:hypothetical protein